MRVFCVGSASQRLALVARRALSGNAPDPGFQEEWSSEQGEDIVLAVTTEELTTAPALPARPQWALVDGGSSIFLVKFAADGSTGCLECLNNALLASLSRDLKMQVRRPAYIPRRVGGGSPLLAQWVSTLLAARSAGASPVARDGTVLVIDADNARIHEEFLLPRADCCACSAALKATHSGIVTDVSIGLRGRSLDKLGQEIEDKCFGNQVGLLRPPQLDLQMPIGASTLWLTLPTTAAVPTLGRALRYDSSRTIAALEALERYAGISGGRLRSAKLSSFNDLGADAVDPRSLGLHSPQSYLQADFRYRPFRPDEPQYWLAAVELATGRQRWVPEEVAFYGQARNAQLPPLLFESSNGCALGSSLAEAAVHGLFEVIERDALLLAWYRARQLPELTGALQQDPAYVQLERKLRLVTGMEYRVFDSTAEHGIPSVIALALGPGAPALVCSAGVALTSAEAARSALQELAGHCLLLQDAFGRPNTWEHAARLLEDANLVHSMEDHGIVNALPAALPRFDFLLKSGLQGELNNNLAMTSETPAQLVLDRLMDRLSTCDLHPLLVDHANPTLTSLGLHACKVVVPGMIPITFGHRNRRIELDRLRAGLQADFDDKLLPHPFM